MREQGTLLNFLNEGMISIADYRKLLRTGKVVAGRERTQIIMWKDLQAWISVDDSNLKVERSWKDLPESGQKSVATAGTAVAIGSDINVWNLVIIANCDNSGNIYVGDSSVNSSKGAKIPPGGTLSYYVVNLSKIYIDADVSGDGISYYYLW